MTTALLRSRPAVRFPLVVLLAALAPAGPVRAANVLIPPDATWKFFRGTVAPSDPGTAWRESNFDDLAWETGQTGIGYGDGDDTTVLTDMEGVYAAIFARYEFTVADPSVFASLSLLIDYDDGFIAYLNGAELTRRSMGAVGQEYLFSDVSGGGHEAGTPERINLTSNLALLAAGRNVLAVEVHNTAVGSTDLSFIPSLLADDEVLTCPTGLTCAFQNGSVQLTWTNNRASYDSIAITRNGVPIAGSPFAGTATSASDATPGTEFDAVYSLVGIQGGSPCPALTCTSTLGARGLGSLVCELALVDGSTQANLSWTNLPGTTRTEIRRETVLVATFTAGEETYIDPNVESDMPEEDTDFEVRMFSPSGTATMNCGSSLCPTITAAAIDVAGVLRAQITIGNHVKEWTSFGLDRTVQGTTEVLQAALPPATAEYIDESIELKEGVSYTYTLRPLAPAGEQAPCDRPFTLTLETPEIASYDPPAGGWDYAIDFEGAPSDQYNPTSGAEGNLDGRWIRSITHDFWDGSAPSEIGAAPDGDAPGGIDVVSRPGLGPCGGDIKTLRILDPGDPSNPAGSLAAAYPDAYTDPSNKAIFLGVDTGVNDRSLLRTGVTFMARWRIDPDAPAYLAATAGGDGEPLVGDALGNIGMHFRNSAGALAAEGPTSSVSFSMNSGGVLLFSATTQPGQPDNLPGVVNTVFRSLWVTVEDPEGDATYSINVYTNGRTTPFAFVTGGSVLLESSDFDFGALAGNYLAIGLPDVGNDGIIEIDAIAYKEGIHVPTVTGCTLNNRPNARVAVTPASGQVTLAGGTAQVTLDGSGSDDGDGGSQGLTYAWAKIDGPAGDAIVRPAGSTTQVNFTAAGTYRYRLTVNDGQPSFNTATAQVSITVLPEGGGRVTFRRGNANSDNQLDLTDPVTVLNFQFLAGPVPSCMDAADADDSGTIDLTDAVYSLNFQFLAGPLPPAPGPDVCGEDPTADVGGVDLGCALGCP